MTKYLQQYIHRQIESLLNQRQEDSLSHSHIAIKRPVDRLQVPGRPYHPRADAAKATKGPQANAPFEGARQVRMPSWTPGRKFNQTKSNYDLKLCRYHIDLRRLGLYLVYCLVICALSSSKKR